MLLMLVCCAALSAQEMRYYVLALLYRGPNATTVSAEESKKLQAGHMANIQKLAGGKKLILAGPMGGKGDLRGSFLFDTADMKQAQEWCDVDPAIKAGTLRVELHPWYSAKGIGILEAPKP